MSVLQKTLKGAAAFSVENQKTLEKALEACKK